MNLLMRLVVVIASAGAMVTAQAVDPALQPGPRSPIAAERAASHFASGAPATVRVPGETSAQRPGVAGGRSAGESRSSEPAVAESDGWMRLLSGLVFVAFIARRKTRWVTE